MKETSKTYGAPINKSYLKHQVWFYVCLKKEQYDARGDKKAFVTNDV